LNQRDDKIIGTTNNIMIKRHKQNIYKQGQKNTHLT